MKFHEHSRPFSYGSLKGWWWLLMLLLGGSLLANAEAGMQHHLKFRDANQAFGQGEDVNAALALYREIEAERGLSANLAFNIASCHYQLENWGLSRLYLERTLLISPNHPDAINNLRVLLKRLKLDEPTPSGLDAIALRFSSNQWFAAGLCLILLPFVVLLGKRVLRALRSQILSTPSAASITFGVLLLVVGSSALYMAHLTARLTHGGVVTAPNALLRQSPFEQSEAVATVQQGRKLQILDRHDSYFLCMDGASNIRGWISSERFETIRP